MPMPQEYQLALKDFIALLDALKNEADLATRNQAYTTLQAVLIAFRRRLQPDQILTFANILPAIVRAIFIDDWTNDEFTKDFGDRETILNEIKSLRRHHNFSDNNAIDAVATVLRKHIGDTSFDEVLKAISNEALEFWDAFES